LLSLDVFDLRQKRVVKEKVYGGKLLRIFYASFPLRYFLGLTWLQKLISYCVGFYKRSSWSRKQIFPFLHQYDMNLDEFVVPQGGFQSFNDFFIRQKKEIHFSQDENVFCSPCEARLMASRFEDSVPRLKVKNKEISLPRLLGPLKDKAPQKGWALTFRLCPLDYHRFHFFDSGKTGEVLKLGTKLDSVNPWALEFKPHIFEWNERQITVFRSDHFGDVFYIEVGALCVGRIHQCFEPGKPVKRGQEKGYFDFGGSTVVLIVADGQKSLKLDPLISSQNALGVEVLVRLGDNLGRWA
jgi:phosphatidylserine decarboxylase